MSVFNTAAVALHSAQAAIATTGHNIANVNTPGYRRQEVILETNTAVKSGSGFIGQGVNVSTVRRVYDDFLERQVTQNESQSAYLDQYLEGMRQIDNVMGDRSAGFSSAIQKFFVSWNDLAGNPTSIPARQAVLGSANIVANNINSFGDYLQSLQNSVNVDIKSMVSKINSYASSIASMNDRIASVQSSGLQAPNDMLDQRDRLVSDLNQLAGVTVVKDSSTGGYNVFLAQGFQLVGASGASLISAKASLYDPLRTEIYDSGGNVQLSSNSMIGGQLGAMLDYRSQALDLAQNSLGQIAIAMTSSVNALHTTGRDLAGNPGGVFFNDLNASPLAFSSSSNTGSAVLTAAISNSAQLTTDDYQLSFSGGAYTLLRLSDRQSWSDPDPAALATAAAQGFSLSISGAPNAGDTFLIRPTVAAANGVGVAITDPALIAAADGSAVAGDTLDNRNALAIAALQNNKTVISGNNTLESGYAVLVGSVGNKTDEINVNQKAQKNLLDQARQAQQSESGINLDEEAANLIRYQQAYQAAAKLIATASTMFDTLLQI